MCVTEILSTRQSHFAGLPRRQVDKGLRQRRVQKEKEIKQHYPAELAALNAEDPKPLTSKAQRQVPPRVLVKYCLNLNKELSICLSSSSTPPNSQFRSLFSGLLHLPSRAKFFAKLLQSGSVNNKKAGSKKIVSRLRLPEAEKRGRETPPPQDLKVKGFRKLPTPSFTDFLGSDFQHHGVWTKKASSVIGGKAPGLRRVKCRLELSVFFLKGFQQPFLDLFGGRG